MPTSPFHLLAKPTGPICNLDCTYCFYIEKENLYSGNSKWSLSDEVLGKYIKDYIESQESSVINFTWQGGEHTLLGVEFFKKAVILQNKYKNGKSIENSFQTNEVLHNDEWCQFFLENNFLVGLSIDGPREIHDKYRLFKGGQTSFDQKIIIANLASLKIICQLF